MNEQIESQILDKKLVANFICDSLGHLGLGITKLHKTFWFAERLVYLSSLTRCTNAEYVKGRYGPVVVDLEDDLLALAEEGKVFYQEIPRREGTMKLYSGTHKGTHDEIPKNIRAAFFDTGLLLSTLKTSDVSKMSHDVIYDMAPHYGAEMHIEDNILYKWSGFASKDIWSWAEQVEKKPEAQP